MNRIRALAYALVFYPGSAVLAVLTLCAIPFGQAAVIAVPRAWGRFQHWCARLLLGTRLRIEGTPPDGVVLVAVKHESFYETYEMLRLFDRPAVVVKAELLDIPIFGRAMLAHGVIPVARETGATALRRMLGAAKAAVAAGRPIVIFPEGTRVPHGEQPPLRPGFAGLYKALGVPVVPIAMDSGRVWGWHRFVKRPGTVTFRIGAPIPPGLSRDEIEARVHAAINALNAS